MVTIFLPAAADTGIAQERTGSPSTCTVQAPHAAMPQPYLVPGRSSSSRKTQSSGISGSTSTIWVRPFTVNLSIGISFKRLATRRRGTSWLATAGDQASRARRASGSRCGPWRLRHKGCSGRATRAARSRATGVQRSPMRMASNSLVMTGHARKRVRGPIIIIRRADRPSGSERSPDGVSRRVITRSTPAGRFDVRQQPWPGAPVCRDRTREGALSVADYPAAAPS